MKSKKSQEGYLLIDHRNSPGLPIGFGNIPGLPNLPIQAQGGKIIELGIATCSHCNTEIILNPDRVRPRGHCVKCHHYICDKPGCNVECVPLKKIADEVMESNARNLNIGEI